MSLFDLLSAPFRRRSRLHPALMGAPGPSPWFMWGKPNITLGDRSFAWKAVSKQGELAGIVALMDGERGAHVVLDFGCYVQPLTGAKLLIWTVSKAAGRVEFLPIVRFAVYDLSSSSPLPNLTEAARQVRHGGLGFSCSVAPIGEHVLPAGLNGERPDCVWPDAFQDIDELLVLVAPQGSDLALWCVRPKLGSVFIYPQDWFNQGPHDFGYQWVARVARVPETGQIVGECVRLPPFTLDSSLRQRLDS